MGDCVERWGCEREKQTLGSGEKGHQASWALAFETLSKGCAIRHKVMLD